MDCITYSTVINLPTEQQLLLVQVTVVIQYGTHTMMMMIVTMVVVVMYGTHTMMMMIVTMVVVVL